jgi:hypothetical protein
MNYYPKAIKESNQIKNDNNIKEDKHIDSCDTIKLQNNEFLEHDYDGGVSLTGIYCKDKLEIIHVEIGVSRGVCKQDYYLEDGKLKRVSEIQEVFPYVDSLATFDYKKLNRVYVVVYEIAADSIKKLNENGEQTLQRKMTIEQKLEEFKKNISDYKKKIEEKKARAKNSRK